MQANLIFDDNFEGKRLGSLGGDRFDLRTDKYLFLNVYGNKT